MLQTRLTQLAYAIAKTHHQGQVDMGGHPYIEHVVAIAEQMKDEHTVCAALLHDIIEDTDCSYRDLLQAGIPDYIVYTVAILTRIKGEPYHTYISRIGTDEAATIVKMADLQHNMDLSRIADAGPRDFDRVKKRYEPAYKYLEATQADRELARRMNQKEEEL